MALTDSVDRYCERLGPEFWAEPLNAVTNLAFVATAIIGYAEARRLGRVNGLTILLCGLAFCIGIGSFLFHTVAQVWAGIADVVPILLFILAYLFAASRYLFGLRWAVAIPAAIAAFALALLARKGVLLIAPKEALNGTEGYAPALALLLGSTILLTAMARPSARLIAAATVVFIASMCARVADVHVCQTFPHGTHFLWHTLNGLMIALLLLALVRHGDWHKTP